MPKKPLPKKKKVMQGDEPVHIPKPAKNVVIPKRPKIDPKRPVVTLDKRKAVIVSTIGKPPYVLLGYVISENGYHIAASWTEYGLNNAAGAGSGFDLFNKKKP